MGKRTIFHGHCIVNDESRYQPQRGKDKKKAKAFVSLVPSWF
jgi:hypothetical protein